jgi:hypothetical protein
MSIELFSLIDAEIARLQEARALIAANRKGPGRPSKLLAAAPIVNPRKKKRNLSPEGRARIAAAVKARWAKQKRAGN